MVRVAINGFGRIGRNIIRAGCHDKNIEWVAINDLTSIEQLAYLLKYDSVYGRFPGTVSHTKNALIINGKKIPVYAKKDPASLPWKKHKVDIVIEATGHFRDKIGAKKHRRAGAKKVLITANSKDPDFFLVHGANNNKYKKKKQHIISNCSCTTNAASHLASIIHANYKIKSGYITTVHGYTSTQNLVDGSTNSSDIRRSRHAALNIIPSFTGAAKAVVQALPALKGKLDGYAWRVPVATGSTATLTAHIEKGTTKEQVNTLFKKVSKAMPTILGYTEDPLVSSDIIGRKESCIFDPHSTRVQNKTLITISGWYDNEAGYSQRIVDVVKVLL